MKDLPLKVFSTQFVSGQELIPIQPFGGGKSNALSPKLNLNSAFFKHTDGNNPLERKGAGMSYAFPNILPGQKETVIHTKKW